MYPLHADIACDQLRELMHNTKNACKRPGNGAGGPEAVDVGLIDEVGGIREALKKLYEMIDEKQGF